jgi:hypothetical protein
MCVQNDSQAYGTFPVYNAPILRQDTHYLQTDQNELSLEHRHLRVPSGASKTITKPVIHLAQIVHLSYTNTNTISKQTETIFDMTQSPRG